MNDGYLEAETFKTVVANTPLVAIDIVLCCDGRMLVGRRINEPAAGSYFVPGGRIRKGENFDQAFRRISTSEIGVALDRSHCRFLGIFDHIYEENAVGDEIGTHYVVLAFLIELGREDIDLDRVRDQHDDVKMVELKTAVHDNEVHEYSRAYAKVLVSTLPQD